MKVIKVTQCSETEEALVEVISPGGDGTPDQQVSCTELTNGQEVKLEVDDEGGVEVGEVTTTTEENTE
jgi:hypothetical protein